MKLYYFDNAATTAVDPKVLAAMRPYFNQKFGNASEMHLAGQEARKAVEEARRKVAAVLHANPDEIIFTGSATESINLAHKGLAEALGKAHFIISAVEHKAVLETCRHLKSSGKIDLTILPVDKYGQINLGDLEKAIRAETALVSVMYVNNEVGTIQPIKEIGKFLKGINPKIYFHTDATQAVQYLDCNVNRLGVDLLSLTGHKIYAPKGIGVLYVRKGVSLIRQTDGGNQEFKLRAGTENVPSIVGLGEAMQLIPKNKSPKTLGKILIREILKIPGIELTGHPTKRAPHIASFVIKGVEGEAVALLLSDKGIMISTGSACTSTELSPSHVLTAMGIPPEVSHGSVRFSLGKETTRQETEYVIRVLPEIVKKLRLMSPKL